MAQPSGEKSEQPTPKKMKEARKEGQVARTPDLGGWATILLLSLVIPSLLEHELTAMAGLLRRALRLLEAPTPAAGLELLGQGAAHAFWSILLLGLMVMVIGVVAALSQGGFALATKQVKPSAKKLNPISGAKRAFGPQAWWEGLKVLLKSSLVALVVWFAVEDMLPLVGGLVPTSTMLEQIGGTSVSLLRSVAVAGLATAALDYLVQRRRIGKQTRMTKDEVKQEHKQSEGDPMLKGARRSRHLAASRNRMIADVADADVVLVNPTHVAVALRYRPEEGAPRVLARGAGAIATRIREVAAEHQVTMVSDVPLARALHGSTEVGQTIPAELFGAVATVLAFVMARGRRGQSGGTHHTPRPSGQALPEVATARRRERSGRGRGGRSPRRGHDGTPSRATDGATRRPMPSKGPVSG